MSFIYHELIKLNLLFFTYFLVGPLCGSGGSDPEVGGGEGPLTEAGYLCWGEHVFNR